MLRFVTTILLITVSVCSAQKTLPDFIKPCKFDNTINECFKNTASAVIPHLIHGYSDLNIPDVVPLKFDKLTIKDDEKLKFYITDVIVDGMENWSVADAKIDPQTKSGIIKFFNPLFSFTGSYEIDGTVLELPINGKGYCNSTIYDATFDFITTFSIVPKEDGKPYAQVSEPKYEFDYKTFAFFLDNLYDGDKEKGAHAGKYLQENLRDALKESNYPILRNVAEFIVSKLVLSFTAIPFNELFILPAS